MNPNPPALDAPRRYADASYAHIEQFAQAIGWELDFRQMDPGPLESRVTEFGTQGLRILRVEFNRSFHQLCRPPKGVHSFGLPDPSSGTLRWRGHGTPRSIHVNFNYEKELDVVNPPGDFGGYVLYFSTAHLSLLETHDDIVGLMGRNGFWMSEEGLLERLRNLLDALTEVARREGDGGLVHWAEVFKIDVPALLARVVYSASYSPVLDVPPFRVVALCRATSVLANYAQAPENVDALSQLAGCSWDTLKRAFRHSVI